MLFNVYASQQKIRTRRVFYYGNIINCSIVDDSVYSRRVCVDSYGLRSPWDSTDDIKNTIHRLETTG